MNNAKTGELETLYRNRFAGAQGYRARVWRTLIADFFSRYVPAGGSILDVGCGYGEFINQVEGAGRRYGMDMNPATGGLLEPGVKFLQQDCSAAWPLEDNSLDLVFTSNFFEHLPNKQTLGETLGQAARCLKPGGRLVALGPNIRYLPGEYWDFWDHYLPLSERSLSEGLVARGFEIQECHGRFLPYTMSGGREHPMLFLKIYLRFKPAWRLLGKQFLVVAAKKGPA